MKETAVGCIFSFWRGWLSSRSRGLCRLPVGGASSGLARWVGRWASYVVRWQCHIVCSLQLVPKGRAIISLAKTPHKDNSTLQNKPTKARPLVFSLSSRYSSLLDQLLVSSLQKLYLQPTAVGYDMLPCERCLLPVKPVVCSQEFLKISHLSMEVFVQCSATLL